MKYQMKPKPVRLMLLRIKTIFSTLLIRELPMKLRTMKYIAPAKDQRKEIDFIKITRRSFQS
jgi:hypothetical protein